MLQGSTILSGQVQSGHVGGGDIEVLTRVCLNPKGNPNCLGKMCYPDSEAKRRADRNNSLCSRCRAYKRIVSLETRKKMSEVRKGKRLGSDNSFFGCTHSEETKRKIGEASKGRQFSLEVRKRLSAMKKGKPLTEKNRENIRKAKSTPEYRAKLSIMFMGERNPFFGKSHSAETRKKISESHKHRGPVSDETRKKQSKASKGSRNPMYGKASPLGSSVGIGGWFNGLHFRSSCELVFLMSHPDDKWISAEGNEYRIPYIDDSGKSRFYFPDFFSGPYLIEVKPRGWDRDPKQRNVVAKQRAAHRFCVDRGWLYIVAEVPYLDKAKVFKLREQGVIKLDRKWEKQFWGWIAKGF